MTNDAWLQYKKYIQSRPTDVLKKMRKIKHDQLRDEAHILRRQESFERTEMELKYINEIIMNRE